MENSVTKSVVKGWGIDADPENHPTYPMRQHKEVDSKRMDWPRPTQQQAKVEILHSNERPNLSAVFGSPVPPRGLSGMIRRYAFQYSESDLRHWVPLMLADRVDMIEGVIEDFRRGHIPNIFAERGMKAALRHNPKGVAKKAAIGALVGVALVMYLRRRK